ncbi:Nse1 non-SMC component of SMC5-6 complex-domain-containing protein [Butyriboletus roseoflavus]|nr:Nse1 non-SMC component of SMC5-6 complex-domain-containing protein [Butyriboletus roseoflavus]
MTIHSSDVQRLFLQAVFSRGILSFKHAQVLWEKCIDAVKAADPSRGIQFDDSRQAWDKFVSNINTALNPLDLEFRHLADEQTGKEMYAVVNTKDDEIAQMATDYTPLEIAYFKAVVEQIMLASHEAYSVSSLAALREVCSLKSNMTKSQAEAVLGSLVAKGWLQRSKRARYSLSTRALLELLPYLKSNYPEECLECTICMEIVTRGAGCNTANCKTRIHYHCFKKLRARRAQCPTCGMDWPPDAKNLKPVGEAAIKADQDEARRTRRKSTTASDEDEDAMRMDEDESEPSQPKPSQRRGKKKAVTTDVDEDEEQTGEDGGEAPPTSQANPRRRSTRTR